jgi:hypothetical protein
VNTISAANVQSIVSTLKRTDGIRASNSPNCLINESELNNMDVGMRLSDNMLYSNYTCNVFNVYNIGYRLDKHVLRPNNYGNHDGIHGHNYVWNPTRPLGEGHRHDELNPLGRSVQFEVKSSDVRQNLWSFEESFYNKRNNGTIRDLRIGYVGSYNPYDSYPNRGGIVQGHSTNRCLTSGGSLVADTSGFIVNVDTSDISGLDDVLQWNIISYVNREFDRGNSGFKFANPELITVHLIEDLLADEEYDSVWTIVQGFTPTNPIAVDFKKISEAISATRLQDSFVMGDSGMLLVYSKPMDSMYIADLTSIAEKNKLTESPYAVSARAILWSERQLEIEEPEIYDTTFFQITGYVDPECMFPLGDWNIYIEDQLDGNTGFVAASDSAGEFWFEGRMVFEGLNASAADLFRIVAVSPTLIDTLFSSYENLTDLALMSYHNLTCFDPSSALNPTSTNHSELNQATWSPKGIMTENTLELKTDLDQCEVSLMDMSGRLLFKNTVGQKHSINVAHMSSGIYILRFVNPETNEIRSSKIWKPE